ncbi:TetR/AcrR family transcriptional regulator [Lentzea sp. JNUCC 0626]|uniref:TetR/AcrR family transcriptional regulator n=1 Tax=Lentzea sp. JNUCC 0626 TaxID=3367513 RepID=UPI003749B6A0
MPAQPADRRTRRSRTALEAALMELITERELAQISISDVTKRADVNRSTFYEHYTGLDDLAASACTALFDELVTSAPLSGSDTTTNVREAQNSLTGLFTHVAEHARLYRVLLGPDGSARVINHLLDRITAGAHSRVEPAGGGSAGHHDDLVARSHDPTAAFTAGAVVGAVVDWLRWGCPGTPERMSALISPQLLAAVSGREEPR